MLPTADAHFTQIGRELAGDVMKRRQVCSYANNATFRCVGICDCKYATTFILHFVTDEQDGHVICALLLQYATAGAPNGVDALYLFRSQRMLQHKNVDVWERATQIDSPGERLEIAFADLYPQKLPVNWKRPKVDIRSPVQNGVRKVTGKTAAVPAAADTNEGETLAELQIASFMAHFCGGMSLAVAVHLSQFSIAPLR